MNKESNVMGLTERIEAHIKQCSPHVKSRESAQLLIAANNRIKTLETALKQALQVLENESYDEFK